MTCASPPGPASAFAVLPDSQFYACAYPEILRGQTEWLIAQRAALDLGAVIHTGDIVDMNQAEQWQVASDALHLLDGTLPYLLTAGNHDLDVNRNTMLNGHFSAPDLAAGPCTELGWMAPNHLENSYLITELRGQPFIFIGLEFGPRDRVLAWAQQLLTQYAHLPAILFTHAYLFDKAARYDRAITPLQPFHPDHYQVTPKQGIADGQDIWETLIEPHENVQVVMSGHVIPDGAAHRSVRRTSGSVVHEILANYQTCATCPCEQVEGGGGYLRILTLSENLERLSITTYSPHYNASLSGPEHQFDVDLDFFSN